MKIATLEEVKEHFKDAKVVRYTNSGFSEEINPNMEVIDNSPYFHFKENGSIKVPGTTDYRCLWDGFSYAEIIEYKNQDKKMRKVIRLDEPK